MQYYIPEGHKYDTEISWHLFC